MSTPAPALTPAAGCRLSTADGRELPLRRTSVRADAALGLARVRVAQTFVNPFPEPLAVTYRLPLPADGAVTGFAFVLAGLRVAGRVERRADARRAFEDALLAGRTAALLEQERADVFTEALGNVPGGATIEVEVEVEQRLPWVRGGWEWRFPTVVGPRYLGAPGQTPDADRLVVDVTAETPAGVEVALRIGDAATGPAHSPSHDVADADGEVWLRGRPDRDVVVRWPVAAPAAGVALETARPAGDADAYGLLTIVPPAVAAPPVRRDLCLLLDTSGSMGGAPLAQLRAFATALVAGLSPGDRLEMIEFSSSARRWRPGPVAVDARARAEASAWIGGLQASGATEMHHAVTEALAPLSPDAQRQVVLMTDGHIGFEREVIGRILRGLPRGARAHVVGVGSAVNRTLTGGVARAGGGCEVVVAPGEDASAAVAALLARTGQPQWVDVTVEGPALREAAPAAVGDLLAGSPARVSLRLDPAGGPLLIRARTAEGTLAHRVEVPPVAEGHGRRVVATRYARERVEDWELAVAGGADPQAADAAIEALGLRHQIATAQTSWVAATDAATVDPGAPTRRVTQPHLLPSGTSAAGVGLAAAALGAAPAAARAAGLASLAAHTMSRLLVGPPAPAPGGPPARSQEAAAPRTRTAKRDEAPPLRARVVSLADGRLVLEITFDADGDWDPARLEVLDAAGAWVGVTPVAGTTRAGRLAAGTTARLVLGWTGAPPTTLRVGGRALQVTA